MDHKAWVLAHYAREAERIDPDELVAGFSQDIRVQMGVAVTVGRDAVRAGIRERQRAGLEAIRHDVLGLWEPEPGVVVAEAAVTYRHQDGDLPTVPVVSIFRFHSGQVVDLRIHLDPDPLRGSGTGEVHP